MEEYYKRMLLNLFKINNINRHKFNNNNSNNNNHNNKKFNNNNKWFNKIKIKTLKNS
jgi:hypothetical protein